MRKHVVVVRKKMKHPKTKMYLRAVEKFFQIYF